MATVFTHAIAALALAAPLAARSTPRRLFVLGALGAVLPDADVIGFRFGIRYEDMLGHRGLSHSLAFAAAFALVATWLAFGAPAHRDRRLRYAVYLFVATASHALLDATTTGGLGVALFAPFDNSRFFFPFRPILVSPIGIRRFFTERGAAVIASELIWVWLPALLFVIMVWIVRRSRRPASRNRISTHG
jgi:inner membrane protein